MREAYAVLEPIVVGNNGVVAPAHMASLEYGGGQETTRVADIDNRPTAPDGRPNQSFVWVRLRWKDGHHYAYMWRRAPSGGLCG